MFKYIALFIVVASLTACSSLAPKSYGDADVEKAAGEYSKGNFEAARTTLMSSVDKEFKDYPKAEVYTILGNVYNELYELDSAIIWHNKALELDPSYYEAWVNLGVCYRLKGNLSEAERCYLKAMEIESNYAELHASLGALYIFKEQPEKAVASLQKSITIDASLPVAHSNLSLAYAYVGEYEKSEQSLITATSLGYKNGDLIRKQIEKIKSEALVEEVE